MKEVIKREKNRLKWYLKLAGRSAASPRMKNSMAAGWTNTNEKKKIKQEKKKKKHQVITEMKEKLATKRKGKF